MSKSPLGQFTVDRVVETQGPFAAVDFLLTQVDLARVDAMAPWLRPQYLSDDDRVVMSFHSYVLDTGRHRILVDACVGDDKERPLRPGWHRQRSGWMQALRAAGLQPEDIDFVCCTHLHADHVGWNTCLRGGRWVPTFPRARYVFARRELAHWQAAHAEALAQGVPLPNHGSYADSVLPVLEAGQADLVDDGHEFEPGVWLEPAPGHTPGTVTLHARSDGRHAVFSGDLLHTPVQLVDLGWNSRFCEDPAQAVQTRRRLVEAVTDTDTVVLPAHFPDPAGGHIVDRAGALCWQAA
jgi:glyoxylase-like metal-dependent hydrolase (beta-lactamase superfamily II)